MCVCVNVRLGLVWSVGRLSSFLAIKSARRRRWRFISLKCKAGWLARAPTFPPAPQHAISTLQGEVARPPGLPRGSRLSVRFQREAEDFPFFLRHSLNILRAPLFPVLEKIFPRSFLSLFPLAKLLFQLGRRDPIDRKHQSDRQLFRQLSPRARAPAGRRVASGRVQTRPVESPSLCAPFAALRSTAGARGREVYPVFDSLVPRRRHLSVGSCD